MMSNNAAFLLVTLFCTGLVQGRWDGSSDMHYEVPESLHGNWVRMDRYFLPLGPSGHGRIVGYTDKTTLLNTGLGGLKQSGATPPYGIPHVRYYDTGLKNEPYQFTVIPLTPDIIVKRYENTSNHNENYIRNGKIEEWDQIAPLCHGDFAAIPWDQMNTFKLQNERKVTCPVMFKGYDKEIVHVFRVHFKVGADELHPVTGGSYECCHERKTTYVHGIPVREYPSSDEGYEEDPSVVHRMPVQEHPSMHHAEYEEREGTATCDFINEKCD